MSFQTGIEPLWSVIAALLGLPVVLIAAYFAPWRALAHNHLWPLFGATTLLLWLLWSFRAGLPTGFHFHLLGLAVYTLMLGWRLATVGVTLAHGLLAWQTENWTAFPLNALCLGVVPVAINQAIYVLVHRWLPPNLFIYIFACAFWGAMLSAGTALLLAIGLQVALGLQDGLRFYEQYLPFLPLYLFAEGFLNGVLTTALIGVKPEWLKTFDDDKHLR